jgi:DNA ligase-1
MAFNVMLAKEYDPKRIHKWENIYLEPKLDGVRVIVFVTTKGGVRYYSRNGRELDMFSHLDEEMRESADLLRQRWPADFEGQTTMFDGEMTGTDFSDISGAIHRKNATVTSTRYYLFIALPHRAFTAGADTVSQSWRLKQMHEARLVVPAARRASRHSDVQKIYANLLRSGFEGAMVKDYGKPWTAKRGHIWMKLKEERTADLRIVGFKEGKGKYVGTLGSLICDYKGKEVPVSGMSDGQRDYIWANRPMYEGAICEVVFQRPTVHRSLRHARFSRMRGLHGEKL